MGGLEGWCSVIHKSLAPWSLPSGRGDRQNKEIIKHMITHTGNEEVRKGCPETGAEMGAQGQRGCIPGRRPQCPVLRQEKGCE